ncbi:MAG TPA: hypothetical protein VJ032_00595 [Thermoanaerobaculia bacterium]|nr:hypothetical protein [Thermoanaerobaculia bacterium]
MTAIPRLIAALWFGAAAFILISAAAVFRAAGEPAVAANVVGALLGRWHYIALAAPVALLAYEWKRARASVIAVLFAAALFAATQGLVDLRIRAIREASSVPISSLDRNDPVRRRFGFYHGLSSILLLLQAVTAGMHIARRDTEA